MNERRQLFDTEPHFLLLTSIKRNPLGNNCGIIAPYLHFSMYMEVSRSDRSFRYGTGSTVNVEGLGTYPLKATFITSPVVLRKNNIDFINSLKRINRYKAIR